MALESVQIDVGAYPVSARSDRALGGERFAETVARVVREANRDQVEAAREIRDLVTGGEGSIHGAMVAMSNAEGSFRLAMEIRNRLIEGVNRLLQTQL